MDYLLRELGLYLSSFTALITCILILIGVLTVLYFYIHLKNIALLSISHNQNINSRLLNTIVQHSSQGLITIDNDGIILLFNPAAQTMFNYSEIEIQGKNIDILIPKNQKKEHRNYINHSEIHAPKIINKHRTLYGLKKNGELFPIELTVNRMPDNNKNYFLGMVRDITDRVNYEKSLVRAKESAERSNKEKSEMLSHFSHELRTPMNAIIGFSELLLENKKLTRDPVVQDYLQQIYLSAEIESRLMDDIFNLSKIELGKLSFSIESCNLSSLINESIKCCENQAKDADIKILYQAKQPLFINADPIRCKQVIINLITNGIKYNQKGGFINITEKNLNNGHIEIKVIDNGIGINSEDSEKIFLPFIRLHTENHSSTGNGIGLTIAKKTTEAMDGKLAYEANDLNGSTFTVTLPSSLNEPTYNKQPEEDENHFSQLSGHALYIEDNIINTKLMHAIFSSTNMKLLCTETAEDGIRSLTSINPKIILMDINLPGISGYEAAKQIKQSKKHKNIPIISLSASLENKTDPENEKYFDAFLEKPFQINRIKSTIVQLTQRTKISSEKVNSHTFIDNK